MEDVEEFILMEKHMRVTEIEEQLMGMENIGIRMDLLMMENGKMINKMEKENQFGQIKQYMWDNLKKGKKMEKVNVHDLMDLNTKEILQIMQYKEVEHFLGLMVDNTKGNEKIIK